MSPRFDRPGWSAALLSLLALILVPALLAVGAPTTAVSQHVVYLPLVAGRVAPA